MSKYKHIWTILVTSQWVNAFNMFIVLNKKKYSLGVSSDAIKG